MPSVSLEVVDEPGAYVARAVAVITQAASTAIAARGRFLIAFSGGSTPRPVYAALAIAPGIDWPRWQIFWSDERCVPPQSPESNYGMVQTTLLAPLAVRGLVPGRVERMQGELDPTEAAHAYDDNLRSLAAGEVPRFDLILLGMGPDGHTASLFPRTAALTESARLVVANDVPQQNAVRLTFTFPLINGAAQLLFLVRGADKAAALHAVLEGARYLAQWPSQGVQPDRGQVMWLVDGAAAHALAGSGASAE